MTIEQFNDTKFSGKETIIYQNQEFELVAVDFEEYLIGIFEVEDDDTVYWKRCENVEIKK